MTVMTIKFSDFAAANLANSTNKLVGVSAPSGGSNFQLEFPLTWTTAGRPSSPPAGLLGYNSNLGQQEFWNGASWVQLAAGGSGSVNLGSINTIAYYASTGTAVSSLMNINNAILKTSSGGVPSWSTTLPSGLTIPTPNITGVTNGSDAASGSVGQYESGSLLVGSAISLSSGVASDIIALPLDAGDWDVSANLFYNVSAGASVLYALAGITQTSATFEVAGTNNNNAGIGFIGGSPIPAMSINPCIGVYRANLSAPGTIYLIAQAGFTGGTVSAYGYIGARRFR